MAQQVTNIFLIDDDLAINYFHKRLFLKLELGATILPFYNGADALEELLNRNQNFTNKDLIFIFLDINMPEMNGWSFLEEYKKHQSIINCEVKIFVLSSSFNPDDLEKAKQNLFVTDYLIKPLMMDGVLSLKELHS
jgi:CheY-like chemotaxis protein